MKSYKTTAAAVVGALGIILTQVYFQKDGDPETTFDFVRIVEALGLLGIGFFARDKDVSSQDHGIRKESA